MSQMRTTQILEDIFKTVRPTPYAHETLTIADTATALTAATYDDAISAVIQVGTAAIRYWLDGTAPTTTAGVLLNDGDVLVLQSHAEIEGFKAIRTTGTSGVIQVCYGV